MSGSEIKMFSRNGKDYSHIYKELVPLLKENINADACILDGEVLVLEKGSLNMVPFGMNKQVALDHDKSVTSNMQICYKVFDTLWVRHDSEEANLMGFALKKRKHIM
jgi:DNA ligase-4